MQYYFFQGHWQNVSSLSNRFTLKLDFFSKNVGLWKSESSFDQILLSAAGTSCFSAAQKRPMSLMGWTRRTRISTVATSAWPFFARCALEVGPDLPPCGCLAHCNVRPRLTRRLHTRRSRLMRHTAARRKQGHHQEAVWAEWQEASCCLIGFTQKCRRGKPRAETPSDKPDLHGADKNRWKMASRINGLGKMLTQSDASAAAENKVSG